jgi:hypothetical protein
MRSLQHLIIILDQTFLSQFARIAASDGRPSPCASACPRAAGAALHAASVTLESRQSTVPIVLRRPHPAFAPCRPHTPSPPSPSSCSPCPLGFMCLRHWILDPAPHDNPFRASTGNNDPRPVAVGWSMNAVTGLRRSWFMCARLSTAGSGRGCAAPCYGLTESLFDAQRLVPVRQHVREGTGRQLRRYQRRKIGLLSFATAVDHTRHHEFAEDRVIAAGTK